MASGNDGQIIALHANVTWHLIPLILGKLMQAPLKLVGLGSFSSMDSIASWKMNGSGMEKEERERGDATSRRR